MRWFVLAAAVAVSTLAAIVGVLALMARRRQTYGDAASETFDVVAVAARKRIESRAAGLAGGTALVVCGSLAVDLREARLDVMGGYLEVDCWAGSVEIHVPGDWRVRLHRELSLGGVVTAPDDRGETEDLPTLEVDARVVGGIVKVVAAG